MNCANHPEAEVAAYCRSCGKALCKDCRKDAAGTVFCAEHLPVTEAPPPAPPFQAADPAATAQVPPPPFQGMGAGSPYTAPPPPLGGTPYVHSATGTPSPGLAFILGFIPGVGAIYNGQYAKGLVHAVVFGLLVTILDSGHVGSFEPLFGIFLAIWVFYMAFEAHHTAAKRRKGEPVEELSSLMNIPTTAGGIPVGPVILIGLGVILLLDTLNVITFESVSRYWPVLLIVGGGYMLYSRTEAGRRK